ncbi:hypothetical protein GC163_11920 [bacterium]|nr:hypothetical protein [bacterium]
MKHANKHIRDAIEYAQEKGWTLRPGHHAFCILYCPAGMRGGCQKSVWSTPRNPEAHARDIRREVDKCPHCDQN